MDMLPPALLLIIALATTSASLGHMIWGKRWGQIPMFWTAAVTGVVLPYMTGLRMPFDIVSPAGVPVLEALLGACIGTLVASRLRV